MSYTAAYGSRALRRLAVVAVLVGLALGPTAARSYAVSRATVVVPRARGDVVAVYARLHAAGLMVTVPRDWSFDSARPPRVARMVPAAGTRVGPGSVVTLYLSCCLRIRQRAGARRPPSYVVPDFVGSAASVAYAWVRGKLGLKAHLGPLKDGGAGSLFLNYLVTRQNPAAGQRLGVEQRSRRANGRSVGVRRAGLAVWGTQSPPCAPPPGSAVVARDGEAVITSHAYEETGTPYVGWYACLTAVGQQRLLTSGYDYEGYQKTLEQVVLSGRFAAFSFGYADKYFNCTNSVEIYDLSTGKPGEIFTTGCSYPEGPYVPGAIDSLSANSNGFAAWRLTVKDSTGADTARLYAYDNHGARLLDSSAPGASTSLTDIKLSGTLLTWSNNGNQHQTTLG